MVRDDTRNQGRVGKDKDGVGKSHSNGVWTSRVKEDDEGERGRVMVKQCTCPELLQQRDQQ